MTERPEKIHPPEDVLSRDVAIRASLDESGVSLAARSRAVAALDRLIGALSDWPAAYLEGKAAKRRLRDEIERERIRAEIPGASRTEADERIIEAVRAEEARRLENKAGVAFETFEELKRIGAEKEGGAERGEPSASSPIDDDWMNAFVRHAEDATSEDLRRLWARVLSREVLRPGSFSRRTLRFMADLDKQVAELCESVAPRVFGKTFFTNPDWDAGDNLFAAMNLQTLGLIAGVAAMVTQNVTIEEGGTRMVLGKRFALVIHGNPGQEIELPGFKLTPLGEEVFSLLAVPDELSLLREVAENLPKAGVSKIVAAPFVPIDDLMVRVFPGETLYESEDGPAG